MYKMYKMFKMFKSKCFNLQSPDNPKMKECSTKSSSSYKLSLWTPTKLSNAHSGSAPSLVGDLARDRPDNPANPNPWIKPPGHEDLNRTRYFKFNFHFRIWVLFHRRRQVFNPGEGYKRF